MPLIFVHYPEGAFDEANRDAMADELTEAALSSERLPNTPFVKSTTWIYCNEYKSSHVYHGGRAGGTKVISIEINVFEGGLDESAKKSLYASFTAIVRKRALIPDAQVAPVYIVVRDNAPMNWGVFGETIRLDDLRNPPVDAEPI
jgi:phenylpyruvate tautomerase PptA (4-oxalocrotonate tautomerase family)